MSSGSRCWLVALPLLVAQLSFDRYDLSFNPHTRKQTGA
jgi:hypothetical protein